MSRLRSRTARGSVAALLVLAGGTTLPALQEGSGAHVYHVAPAGKDSNSCTRARDPATPKRTIRAGLRCAGPGDTVDVAAGTYTESLIAPGDWPSGSPGKHVVLRARPGGDAVWESADAASSALAGFAHLRDASWVRIEGFVFEGSTARHCVIVENTTGDRVRRPLEGIEVVRNFFRNNGHQTPEGRPACLFVWKVGREVPGADASVLVEENTFEGNAGNDVHVHSSTDVVIVRNEMRNGRPGFLPFSSDWTHRGVFVAGETKERGGRINNRRITIRENRIHGFDGTHPHPGRGRYRAQGIKCDVNGDTVLIEANVIHDLPHEDDTGIMVESRCDAWTVRDNVIYRTGSGIRIGSRGTVTAANNELVGNTIYDVSEGISLTKARGTLVRNNIVWCTGSSACMIESDSSIAYGGNRWRHNLWYSTGGRRGRIAGRGMDPNRRRPNLTCRQWLRAARETNSLCDVDPVFLSTTPGAEDFRLRPGSPALGAGEGGADLGASFRDTPGRGRYDPRR